MPPMGAPRVPASERNGRPRGAAVTTPERPLVCTGDGSDRAEQPSPGPATQAAPNAPYRGGIGAPGPRSVPHHPTVSARTAGAGHGLTLPGAF